MPILEKNGVTYFSAPVLARERDILHAFTARGGGVSTGDFFSLNIGQRRGDDLSSVRKNIAIMCRAIGFSHKNMTVTLQEHSDNIALVTREDAGKGLWTPWTFSGCDGIVTDLKNVPLMCYTADCAPVLLYARDKKVIAAVHAGWRGSIARIAQKAVFKMAERFGADPKNILAAIGPHIKKCCYEVGGEVAKPFIEAFGEKVAEKCESGKYKLDLTGANVFQLKEAGLSEENISSAPFCTRCDNALFFSHRAQNGRSGNLGAVIELIGY